MHAMVRIIWEKLKTALVVITITFLIWFAADQNVLITQSFDISIRLASAREDQYAAVATPPYQRTLKVVMQGRRRRLQEFSDRVGSRPIFTVRVDPSRITSDQPQTLSSADDVLMRIKKIRDSHLTIKSVEPENLKARIDEYVTLKNVHVKPIYADLKVRAAKIIPEIVSLQLPRFVANQLGNTPLAIARVEQHILASREPNGSFQVEVALSFERDRGFDPGARVSFIPPMVKITGQSEVLKRVTVSKGPIQITWSIPDVVQKKYVVVAEQVNFRVNVDVSGPKDRVTELDPANILGLAEVFAGDMDDPGPGKEIVREVKFVIINPADFPDCALIPESREIRFRLEPRPGPVLQPINGG